MSKMLPDVEINDTKPIKMIHDDKSPNVWADISYEVREAAMDSSIHGLSGIYRSKNIFIKIAWLVLLLASSAYCAYAVIQNIQAYLKYDVVTNIFDRLEIPTVYPRVSICNENPFMNDFGYNLSKNYVESIGLNLEEYNLSVSDLITYRYSAVSIAGATLGSDAEKIGLSLEDMLIWCSYNTIHCQSSDFVYYFNPNYGACYSFNSGVYSNGSSKPILTVTKAFGYNGLALELFAGNPSNIYSLSGSSGIHLFVNNQSVFDAFFDGVMLSVGTHNTILVNRVFTENLPSPYSDCTSDEDIKKSSSKLVQMMLTSGYDYRYTDCIDMCYEEYGIENCQCQDGSSIVEFPGVPFCLDAIQVNCSIWVYTDFYNMDVKTYCEKKCPLECNSVQYTLSITSNEYPTPSYYEYLINHPVVQKNFNYNTSAMTIDAVRSSVVSFFMSYADLSYTKIETDAKTTISDLIGQIGGYFGLFVGMSFLSFFEILDLIVVVSILLIKALFFKLREKKLPRVKPNSEKESQIL